MAITKDDISLDKVIPITKDCTIEEVLSEFPVLGSDMTVRITSDNVLLELQLPFSSHSRRFLDETCKACHGVDKQHMSVDPCPRFLWLSKYLPKSALASVSEKKGAFIPAAEFKGIETEASDNMRKTGTATVNGKSQVSEETKQNIQNISDNNAVRDGKVKPEVSNDMVRSSSYTVANKAQMLAMPQFELRDNLIKCELLKREESYTFTKDYRFFVGTYNVNGQSPKESLLPWLKGGTEPPDIYLVGFQELDLSKEAFIFSDTPKEQEWSKAVHEGLHPESKYAMIKVIRLVGIMLLFYVKKELAEYISAIEAEYVGTGIMGRMGNKGAVGIRFNFHNSSLCIVNCHLAAHTEEYERRNQDFRDICSRLTFRSFDPVLPNLPIMKHDTVLWFGDLNYRISDVDVEQVKKLIDERDFKTLYKYDQLKKQMEEKAVFDGFTEGELKFQPTYKYDTGSDQWDTSEKCRTPAWCDRILWKGKNVKQLQYSSHLSLKTSDHKPVSSIFEIGIKVVNEELYRKTFEEIVRTLDKMENECIPSVSLSEHEFYFKDVKYMQRQVQTFTIYNDGQVPCQFQFIQKLEEPAYCKPWLTAQPCKGFVAQGAKLEIELEVFVNKTTATKLTSQEEKLEDILILHLERGKDYFVPISGNYLPSCFGSSLQALCYMREPIQDMPPELIQQFTLMPLHQQIEPSDTLEKQLDIPKELWMLVEHLYRNACYQADLFQQPGLRTEFEEIRDCLDTGMPDSLPGSNHSVAEALLLFLDALPEPVICYSHYHQSLDSSGSHTQCKQVISTLPQCHKNAFNYLMAFLRELLKYFMFNNLDVSTLASIFGSLLLRPPPAIKQDAAQKKKVQEFIEHFISKQEDIS
ncbi:I5P2 phosphatase, partial [Polypterus senegalus]|nr:I5P2 phosphatase [Polypterus senegalus]